jgi:hypothetical protein
MENTSSPLSSTAKTKFAKYKSNIRSKHKLKQPKKSTKPIRYDKLHVHELKREANIDLQRLISEMRREFYINIYKTIFRSWFTYAITGCLLAVCHGFFRNGFSFCFPPIVVTIFLLWKVSLDSLTRSHIPTISLIIYFSKNFYFHVFKLTKFSFKNRLETGGV